MKTFIRVRRDFNLISDISKEFLTPIKNNIVAFPSSLGFGSLKGISFPSDLNIYVGRYDLNIPWELEIINEFDTGAFCIFTSVMSNKITIKMEDEWVPIDKDSPKGLFFYSPGASVEVMYPKNEAFKSVAVTFTNESIKAIMDDPDILQGVNPVSPFIYFDETIPEAENLINKLASICDDNSPSRFDTYIVLLEFLSLTLNRIFVSNERYNLSGLFKEDIKKIFSLKHKLLENTQTTPKISDLASQVGMSETKMVKLFKQVFNRTMYQFAQNAKITKAKELLSSKNFNVSEVGYMVGYTNMTHFGKAFKKYHKVNPSEYLKNVLKKD